MAARSVEWVGPVKEERTLRNGLLRLALSVGEEQLFDFPKRPNGTPRLLRQSFFDRLLKADANLTNSHPGDVTGAQPDVKARHCQVPAWRHGGREAP